MSEIGRPKRYLSEVEVVLLKNQGMIMAGVAALLAMQPQVSPQASAESQKLAKLVTQVGDELAAFLETAA